MISDNAARSVRQAEMIQSIFVRVKYVACNNEFNTNVNLHLHLRLIFSNNLVL